MDGESARPDREHGEVRRGAGGEVRRGLVRARGVTSEKWSRRRVMAKDSEWGDYFRKRLAEAEKELADSSQRLPNTSYVCLSTIPAASET
jgi:hypothetical protein